MTRVDDLQHLLNGAGFVGAWNVTTPPHGTTGRAFVARRSDEAVFVKLAPSHPAYERLSELGVTPPILMLTKHFTVFRYVEGDVPDRTGMRDNASSIIDMLAVVQRDEPLTRLLAAGAPDPTFSEHLAVVVARLIEQTTWAAGPAFRSSGIETSLERLRNTHHAVGGVPLVPSHTDPSPPDTSAPVR